MIVRCHKYVPEVTAEEFIRDDLGIELNEQQKWILKGNGKVKIIVADR